MADSILSLYVWPEFERYFTSGLAFAIAPDLDSARQMVIDSLMSRETQFKLKKQGRELIDSWGPVTIHPIDAPVSYALCGGWGS